MVTSPYSYEKLICFYTITHNLNIILYYYILPTILPPFSYILKKLLKNNLKIIIHYYTINIMLTTFNYISETFKPSF